MNATKTCTLEHESALGFGNTDPPKTDTPRRKGSLSWDSRRTRRLFRAYKKGGGDSVRDEIFCDYLNLVEFMAKKYSGRGVDYDDLYQEGCLGLLTAIDRFDPSRGFEFHTYATHFIQGRIRQYFRAKAWPCSAPKSVKSMALKIKRLGDELGRRPTEQEIVERCEIPPDKVADAMAASMAWEPVSFYKADSTNAINPMVLRSFASEDPNIETAMNRIVLQCAARTKLDHDEANVIKMYYFDEMSQREIAKRTGTYQMMVSRTLQKGIHKLGRALTGEELMAS